MDLVNRIHEALRVLQITYPETIQVDVRLLDVAPTLGLGMGLSIVRGIADSHSVQLHLSARAEGGLIVRCLFQKPIKGLFAGGEITGGVHGASRLGTVAVIDAPTFGMIAGEELAKL